MKRTQAVLNCSHPMRTSVYEKSKVENLGANPTDGRQEASHDWRRSWQIGKKDQSGEGLETSKNQE